jgi:anti-sigma-K factor RskA
MTRLDPDLDRLAGEYVLGLAEGHEAARAERLVDEDEAFRAAVAFWRGRLGELDALAAPAPPPDDLWARIETGLDAPAPVAATPQAARTPLPAPLTNDRANAFTALWRNLAFWRAAGLAGAFAALLLAFGLPAYLEQGERPVHVAVLQGDDNRPAAVVHAFADGRAELIPLQAVNVPQGRSLEVWTIADQAQGLVSIGVLDRVRTIRLDLGSLPRPGPNQLFAISLEPERGSPTGQPTGPVLMKGVTSPTL